MDALLDDPMFFAPFVPFFDPRLGRPSTPMEVYLRLMFLKFRYRLGYETLCAITRAAGARVGVWGGGDPGDAEPPATADEATIGMLSPDDNARPSKGCGAAGQTSTATGWRTAV